MNVAFYHLQSKTDPHLNKKRHDHFWTKFGNFGHFVLTTDIIDAIKPKYKN